MSAARSCAVPACHEGRSPELPLCRAHWRAVPGELRAQVARQYRFGQTMDPALQARPWSIWAGRAVIAAINAPDFA